MHSKQADVVIERQRPGKLFAIWIRGCVKTTTFSASGN